MFNTAVSIDSKTYVLHEINFKLAARSESKNRVVVLENSYLGCFKVEKHSPPVPRCRLKGSLYSEHNTVENPSQKKREKHQHKNDLKHLFAFLILNDKIKTRRT